MEPASNQFRVCSLESSLNYGTTARLEHDGFHRVLDCLVTHALHWAKTNRMRDPREGNVTDNLKPDENHPLGNIFPDYKVDSGERYKLLTNDQPLVGSSDSDWHHPLNISEAALKRKREKERAYSS